MFVSSLFPLDFNEVEKDFLEQASRFQKKRYTIIPYFQQYTIFPGFGALFQYRLENSNIGYEIDVCVSSIYFLTLVKENFSMLYYFNDSGHQVSLGLGTTESFLLTYPIEKERVLTIPVAYGYTSDDKVFTRIGAELIMGIDHKRSEILPFISVGYAF